MKKIGFIGSPPALTAGSKDNTGNMIHSYAARSLFENPAFVSAHRSEENIERLRSEISHLGFIAATNLHVKNTPDYIQGQVDAADFVEKLDLPVCVFGFGCHAHLGATIEAANVDPRSVRLLRVLAERSKTVGVRGAFTADLCAKYGVKNVTVVGCQSAYVAALRNTEQRALTTSGERPVTSFSWGPDEAPMLKLAMAAGAAVIGQGDFTEEGIAKGQISRASFLEAGGHHRLLQCFEIAISKGEFSRSDYYDYIQRHFSKFYNVPDWCAHIQQNYDFCVGTRFHGNMAALLAGVPALWIEHDMRTRELCEHLGLPSLPSSRLSEYRDLKQIAVECDYGTFWSKMPPLAREFLNYLNGNGVGDLLAKEVSQALHVIANNELPAFRCGVGI